MNISKQIICFGICLLSGLGQVKSQAYLWTKAIHPTHQGQVTALAASKQGDVYIAALSNQFIKTTFTTFGLSTDYPHGEVVISKADSSGSIRWTKTFSGSNARIFDMKLDQDENIIISGGFYDSLKLGTQTYLGASISSSGFIAKLDTAGKVLWANVIPSILNRNFVTLCFDVHDTLIIASGKFSGFYPALRKLSTSGKVLDSLNFDSKVRIISDVAIDPSGNVYVAGACFRNALIDTMMVPTPLNNRGYLNLYGKLNLNLDALWLGSSNHATADESGQVECFGGQVAFLSNEFPSGALNPRLFKVRYYNSSNVLLRSDSVTNQYQFSSKGRLGLSSTNSHLLLTVPVTSTQIELRQIDIAHNDTVFTRINASTHSNYPKFAFTARSLFFTTSFHSTSATVNSVHTFTNRSGGTGTYVPYKQLLLKFASQNCTDSKSQVSISNCGEYVSPSGKYTWMNSGTYQDTVFNQGGCDSVITIQFTQLQNSASQSVNSCGLYTSPSGKYQWMNSGNYTDTVLNSQGCDSIISITLTQLQTSSNLNLAACFEMQSPSGKYLWTTSGSYNDTLVNSKGCDSLISVQLQITDVDPSIQQNANVLALINPDSSSTYQWMNCDNQTLIAGETDTVFIASSNGRYALIASKNGCADTSECTSVVGLGFAGLSHANLKAFPNPASDVIHIEHHKPGVYTVRNLAGQVLMLGELNAEVSTIQIAELPAGSYFLQVNESVLRFVKE